MDEDVVLGYLLAAAALSALVYVPLKDIQRTGSLSKWARRVAAKPIEGAATVLMWVGMCAFFLWMLTGGRVPIAIALAAPVGVLLLIVSRRSK